jgi:chromosome segregation ATPase
MSTETSSERNQRFIAIAIVAIIALLGINGYLLFSKVNQDKLIAKQGADLIKTEQTNTELQQEFYEVMSSLEQVKTQNTELNSIIEAQKTELETQRERISRLLYVEKDLEAAQAELVKFRAMRDQYVTQINKLTEENQQLSSQNEQLNQKNTSLNTELEENRQANEELRSQTASLTSENESLQEERERLTATVVKASVVSVDDITVNGYRIKKNGNESFTRKADKTEGLQVCFEAQENTVVEPGSERFYLRVIDPLGETMALDELGSGIITDANEKKVRYTQYRDADYSNTLIDVCMNWQPEIDFAPGLYLVEVYNKGHLSGSTTFTLK